MSTRATYQFVSDHDRPRARYTFYGHYDGYEAGAAFRLWRMHHSNRKGGFADRFHGGNDDVELTPGHDAHGDTEYQYTLTSDGQLTVKARVWGDNVNRWRTKYVGHYAEFVNQHLPADWCGDGSPAAERLQEVSLGYGRRGWRTRSQLEAEAAELKEKIDVKGWKQYTGQLLTIKAAIREYDASKSFELA
ncbi:MAG: hypothetical protein CMK32_09735 [Porticoccaceae bacterium]|nr:hypothetical protein [Porticoccaceae bacterium]